QTAMLGHLKGRLSGGGSESAPARDEARKRRTAMFDVKASLESMGRRLRERLLQRKKRQSATSGEAMGVREGAALRRAQTFGAVPLVADEEGADNDDVRSLQRRNSDSQSLARSRFKATATKAATTDPRMPRIHRNPSLFSIDSNNHLPSSELASLLTLDLDSLLEVSSSTLPQMTSRFVHPGLGGGGGGADGVGGVGRIVAPPPSPATLASASASPAHLASRARTPGKARIDSSHMKQIPNRFPSSGVNNLTTTATTWTPVHPHASTVKPPPITTLKRVYDCASTPSPVGPRSYSKAMSPTLKRQSSKQSMSRMRRQATFEILPIQSIPLHTQPPEHPRPRQKPSNLSDFSTHAIDIHASSASISSSSSNNWIQHEQRCPISVTTLSLHSAQSRWLDNLDAFSVSDNASLRRVLEPSPASPAATVSPPTRSNTPTFARPITPTLTSRPTTPAATAQRRPESFESSSSTRGSFVLARSTGFVTPPSSLPVAAQDLGSELAYIQTILAMQRAQSGGPRVRRSSAPAPAAPARELDAALGRLEAVWRGRGWMAATDRGDEVVK
ncbi:hypothetical protein BC830DRAFT_1144020, partial [Chytriomyces sp. MP71]